MLTFFDGNIIIKMNKNGRVIEMRKKFLISLLAGAILFSNIAFAATGQSSYAEINKSQTSADGQEVPMEGTVSLRCGNYNSSDRNLWGELYQVQWGPDYRIGGVKVSPGSFDATTYGLHGSIYNYYVHLDPDGPNTNGCNGWGEANN